MTEDLNTLREALEPCPWCGEPMAHVVVIEGSTFRWRKVQGCCTDGPEVRHDTLAKDQKAAEADSRARAIATWNRRAPRLEAAAVPELSYGDTMRLAVKAGLLESYDERRFGGYAAGGAELMRFASLVRSVPVGEVPDGWVESNTLPPDGTPVLLRWPDDNPEADVPWRYAVGRYQAKRSVHHWWSAESGLPRSFVVSPSHWRAI